MKTPTSTKAQPKRRAFASGPTRNGGAAVKSKAENPFDKFANARKKHEVLNRRVKGEDRNMGRAREKAIDERKTKLLKDYQSSKKSNTILDKRFGESDPTLSLEERMFMRFQKEKVKHVRNSSAFNLESGDTEILTHRGQVLGNSNLDDHDWVSSDEEEGKTGSLNKQVVDSLHFGGGLQHKRGGPTEEIQKPRLDALQEIVMKSKLHKMQKKEAREEQEDERTKLDKAYQDLFSGQFLEFNKNKSDKSSRDRAGIPQGTEDLDDYDQALKEMSYEAKLPASERTKSAEEIALEEQKRIEELEEARIQRMKQAHWAAKNPRAVADEEEDGKAGKRKHRTDDEIEDAGFAPTAIKANKRASRKEAAVEDLEASNATYNEYIMQDEEYEDSSEEEGSDEEGDDEDEEEDDEGESEQSEGEDGDSEDQDEEDNQSQGSSDPEGEEDEDQDELEGSEDEDDDEEEEEEVVAPAKKSRSVAFAAGTAAPAVAKTTKVVKAVKKVAADGDAVNIEMPHKIDCPPDLEAFDELVEQYVVDPNVDLQALIERILAWNNVNLPGAEGKENRNLMHNFLDVLLKHFMRVGDSLARLDVEGQKGTLTQLDFLSGAIFKVSGDISEVTCAALWGRTIKILHAQLQKRLRDYAQGEREVSCWPSLGRLLLLQLLGRVFSVTDLKNDVVGPASLLLCQCLSQCPVSSTSDLASGLLASSVLVSYHGETKKYVPEVVSFVNTVLSLYLPGVADDKSTRRAQDHQGTFNLSTLASSRSDLTGLSKQVTSAKINWSHFALKLADEKKAAEASAGILSSAYALLDKLVSLYQSQSSLPEVLAPVLDTLRAIRPQSKPHAMPVALQQKHLAILEKALGASENAQKLRQPLQWRKSITTSIETKTPRFQLDYTFKKDIDPDQDRVKMKQLTRQLKREKKAAMRELRRDSDFIDAERYKEQQEAKEHRRAERVKNFGFMEEQQATINLQVRKGGGLMKGGGSGVVKKSRVKRL